MTLWQVIYLLGFFAMQARAYKWLLAEVWLAPLWGIFAVAFVAGVLWPLVLVVLLVAWARGLR